ALVALLYPFQRSCFTPTQSHGRFSSALSNFRSPRPTVSSPPQPAGTNALLGQRWSRAAAPDNCAKEQTTDYQAAADEQRPGPPRPEGLTRLHRTDGRGRGDVAGVADQDEGSPVVGMCEGSGLGRFGQDHLRLRDLTARSDLDQLLAAQVPQPVL